MDYFFKTNLKHLRKQRNFSQQQLADKLKIDRSTISLWESGKIDVTIGNVIKIAIRLAIKLSRKKQLLKIKHISYTILIELDDIYYIKTSEDSRGCIIATKYGDHLISKPLKQIFDMLNNDFVYTHGSCIVNKNNVVFVDKKNRVIRFKDNSTIDLLSRNYKDNI